MDIVTITRRFAEKLAEALVDNYNTDYNDMSASQRYFAFRELYHDLKTLGFPSKIGNALGDMDMRNIAFAEHPSMEDMKAYMMKHNITPKLWT